MFLLCQTMRWYGPNDPVPLSSIRQAGATGVVSALHHIENGAIWEISEIEKRKKTIESAGLTWEVVESLPVHENIKTHSGNYTELIENYKQSLINLSACGIKTVCYNFMPLLDWVRTNLVYELPSSAKALRFEPLAIAAFDIFILKRPNAIDDYDANLVAEAKYYLKKIRQKDNGEEEKKLIETILLGLPGSEEKFTLDELRNRIKRYKNIDDFGLAKNLNTFLNHIIPTAEKYGIDMAIHPDDPPFSIFGLPRIVSTYEDFKRIISNISSKHNGITYCTGSLGVRTDNDLIKMIQDFGEHIHFIHLRNITRDLKGNFYESEHLDGTVPMIEIIIQLVKLQQKRKKSLPMRPDHGHQILDDLKKETYPGYTAIGRLKGLAELRGVELAIKEILLKTSQK
ncbi:mannonate dehydratase [Aquimarina celericrescens]|uniref:Mannonate dehydratase n=1 Tax=Aquimarina celericrescens TaxID=1964542 RepID=A0ABW5AZJ5_9FLAO|nr:mannonate dehydratase [Aquimarina celericrescens]